MILHNPTETAVRDYPIQDPASQDVALWGILPGETLDFPKYVGEYLLGVYGFLQEVVTKEQLEDRRKEQEKVAQGKHFSQTKIIEKPGGFVNQMVQPPPPTANELKPAALRQEGELISEMTTGDETTQVEVVSPQTPSVGEDVVETATSTLPTQSPQGSISDTKNGVLCPSCGGTFQSKGLLKTHYAHKHLKIPGVD